jgi:hypothetical protein
MARDGVAMARRLALVAENALLNGDPHRAFVALFDLQQVMATPRPSKHPRGEQPPVRWYQLRSP